MRPTLFLHIPRTGGIGYRRLLKPAFHPHEIREEPARVNRIPIKTWHETFEHNPAHLFIAGHWDWGIVDKIPDVQVITNIRNPVDRCVSSFQHHLHEESRNEWNSGVWGTKTFSEFIQRKDGYVRMSNAQCRQLAGLRWTEEIDEVDEKVFELAIQNLKNCFVFNITADGVRAVPTRKGNELYWAYYKQNDKWNITAPGAKPLDDSVIDSIISMNQFDMRLYEYVRDKWQDQSLWRDC